MTTSNFTHDEIVDINALFDFLEKDQMYGEMGVSAIAAIRRELPGLAPLNQSAAVATLRQALLTLLDGVVLNVTKTKMLDGEDIRIAYEVLKRTNHLADPASAILILRQSNNLKA